MSGVPGAPSAPVRKGILRLAGPLIVSFWLRSAFNLVDSIYASQLPGVGDESLAAIGLAAPFQFLMIACWVGSSNGLTSRLSAAMGAGEGEKIERYKRAAMRIIRSLTGVFFALAAAAWLFADWYAPDEVTASQFRIYAPIVLAGSGLTAFWSILPDSIVKAHHDTRSTMWAGLMAAFSNIGLNTLFVFVFHWGVAGIALATVLARLFSLVYAIRVARRHEDGRINEGLHTTPSECSRPVRDILLIAVPSGLTFALMAVESLIVNSILSHGPAATATVAAWGIFDRAAQFMAMPVIAIGAAMLPFAARLYGEGNFVEIRKGVRVALTTATVYSVAVVVPLALLLSRWIAIQLADGESTRSAMETALNFLPLAVLFLGPTFLHRSAFEGMQRPRPGLITAFVRSLFLVVPFTWIGLTRAADLGWSPMAGACAGFTSAVALSSAMISWWFWHHVSGPECNQLRTNT